ncbi:MAG: VWA domain-containing protein [Planctomycetaceae bacterium]|jgi:Mg-chelatase subunit ChlD|nr:VWA domain-containing protein [Planctomycetaceae bacterium]
MLEFTHPYLLFLLLLLIVIGWGFWRSLLDFSRGQRIVLLVLRTAILLLLILAAAGLTMLSPTHETMVVFLVDQSRSIDENAKTIADNYLHDAEKAAGKRPYAVVPFASTPQTPEFHNMRKTVASTFVETTLPTSTADEPLLQSADAETSADTSLTDTKTAWTNGWADGTDIAAALEPAIAVVPPDYVPRIVLISDGNETSGDSLTHAIRSGIAVSTVPLPSAVAPEVQLSELRTPPQIRQGEPFYLEVVVQSNQKTNAAITVYRGGFKTAEETCSLEKGENIFRFKQSIDDQRQTEFSATIESKEDTILDNNKAEGLVYVGGKPRVLLIESDAKAARGLASALKEQGIDAEIRPPEGTPRTLDELENFEAVLMSNVPATELTVWQMNILRSYVSDLGGGFVMLGGEQSFGLGGYYKTPIEEILPVRSDFEKEKEKPSLAICLVIDRSGSMGGQKMEMAKDAAKSAVELLTPRDYASVIAFDSVSYVVAPMQSAASVSSITSQISTIEAGGGTSIYPGMVDAYDQLTRASAKLKHVILLTDGYSESGDFDGIMRQMVNAQITVSTIGVGDADNDLLQHLAELGQGRHYICDDPQAIPQVFAKETMEASKSAIKEEPFTPVVITPTDVLSGVNFEGAPVLEGFVVTRPKSTSQVVLSTESGEPLLAWWRYGLGMSVAFTSDAKPKWAAEWLTWDDFPLFWAQVIRHTMRKSEQRGVVIELAQQDSSVHITLDAADDSDQYVNKASGTMTVIRPDLSKEELVLKPTAPGRYEAEIPADKRGGYHLQTTLTTGERMIASQSRGVMIGYPDELRLKPANTDLLERIAASTDGTFQPRPESLFEPDLTRTAWKSQPLWQYLLTIAAFLFVVDVLLRRVDFARRKKHR